MTLAMRKALARAMAFPPDAGASPTAAPKSLQTRLKQRLFGVAHHEFPRLGIYRVQ